jgi:hypothetical protein
MEVRANPAIMNGYLIKKMIPQNRFKWIFVALAIFAYACNGSQSTGTENSKRTADPAAPVHIPDFNADSAYAFVKKQLLFGPRVPGSESHAQCARWMAETLRLYADTVFVQEFKARVFNNTIYDGQNIIATFNPKLRTRILLGAHWDSRPFADYDPDPTNHNTPIDGANDGASGTGVLMEIARQLKKHRPDVGIDIVLFDLEDYGPPQEMHLRESTQWWGLGSQYWSRNFHVRGYRAKYGILLDMVGAENAVFPREGFSVYYAPDIVERVWQVANELGFGSYFVKDQGAYITDDHYFVNTIARIPMINIIHLDPASSNGTFFDHWHTVNDNLEKISPATLRIVGQTVLTVIFKA